MNVTARSQNAHVPSKSTMAVSATGKRSLSQSMRSGRSEWEGTLDYRSSLGGLLERAPRPEVSATP
jgi:hypothetical protein